MTQTTSWLLHTPIILTQPAKEIFVVVPKIISQFTRHLPSCKTFRWLELDILNRENILDGRSCRQQPHCSHRDSLHICHTCQDQPEMLKYPWSMYSSIPVCTQKSEFVTCLWVSQYLPLSTKKNWPSNLFHKGWTCLKLWKEMPYLSPQWSHTKHRLWKTSFPTESQHGKYFHKKGFN